MDRYEKQETESLQEWAIRTIAFMDHEVEIRTSLPLRHYINLERQFAYLGIAPFQAGLTYKRLMALIDCALNLCLSYGYDGNRYIQLTYIKKGIETLGISDNTLVNQIDTKEMVDHLGGCSRVTCECLQESIENFTDYMTPEEVGKVDDDRRYAKGLFHIYENEIKQSDK